MLHDTRCCGPAEYCGNWKGRDYRPFGRTLLICSSRFDCDRRAGAALLAVAFPLISKIAFLPVPVVADADGHHIMDASTTGSLPPAFPNTSYKYQSSFQHSSLTITALIMGNHHSRTTTVDTASPSLASTIAQTSQIDSAIAQAFTFSRLPFCLY